MSHFYVDVFGDFRCPTYLEIIREFIVFVGDIRKKNSAFDQAKTGMSSTEMGSSSRDIGVGTIEALVKAAKNIFSTLWMAISGCRLAMTSATSGTYNPI
jgi:hypothetical protein